MSVHALQASNAIYIFNVDVKADCTIVRKIPHVSDQYECCQRHTIAGARKLYAQLRGIK
jgi:hypothetical protein